MKKQPLIPLDMFDKNGKLRETYIPENSQPYYFTFPKCSVNSGKYVKLYAETSEDAKERMNCFYGVGRWAFQFDLNDWTCEDGKTVGERFNLTEIEIKPLKNE